MWGPGGEYQVGIARRRKRSITARRLAPREGRAENRGGDVDDGDHSLVGHARRAAHADHADDFVVGAIRRGDHSDVIVDAIAGLLPDEDLHTVGAQAVVEQVEDVALLVESLEQPAELVDRRQLTRA